jgi:hypothetical protein
VSSDTALSPDDDRLLTEPEAAEILRVSADTLRRLRNARPPQIGHIVVGARSPRYRKAHIDAYMRSRECDITLRPNGVQPIASASAVLGPPSSTLPSGTTPSGERGAMFLLAQKTFKKRRR